MSEAKCVPLASEHVDAAAHILTSQFCGAEPLFRACGISYDEAYPIVRLLCQRSSEQGELSTVCLVDGEVAAAFLSQDLNARILSDKDPFFATPEGIAGMIKLAPAGELVKRLRHKLFEDHPEWADAKEGVLFHQFMVAVSKEFTRHGLCSKIYTANLQQAAAQGFTTAIVECSGKFSLAAALKAGYVEHNRILYGDFEFNGTKPLNNSERDTECVLCTRDLKLL